MKVNHIGYLVKKMEKALPAFLELGYKIVQEIMYDDFRDINICFIEKDGYVVELICPASKESVVANLISKIGNSPYHICYETENLESEILNLQKQRYVMCSEPHEAVACGGNRVLKRVFRFTHLNIFKHLRNYISLIMV